MKSRKWAFLLGVCLFAVLLIAGLLLTTGERFTAYAPAKQTSHEIAPVTPTPIETDTSDTPAVSETGTVSVLHAFRTDSVEKQVLWQVGKQTIFVQNGQLIYGSGAEAASEQTLYTWNAPLSSQAWLNGEYLLIGTQLISGEGNGDGYRGSWLIIRTSDNPAVFGEQKMFFGPDDLLSTGLAKEPSLFFVQWRNAEMVEEFVLDPSQKQWKKVEGGGIDISSGAVSRTAAEPYQLAEPKVIQLAGESTVYVFTEPSGMIVYYTKPYYMVRRYDGYHLLDAQLMPFLDGRTSQVIGLLQDQSGKEWMSFLSYDPRQADDSFLPGVNRMEKFMQSAFVDEHGTRLRVIETMSSPGDVILCHPFLYHTPSQNHSGVTRFMCNRTTPLKERMRFDREDGTAYSPLELSIKRAIE
ncbi:hypothetical protein SAMN05518847_110136 [Paenibacillus sp. OV219]|nr:hypothetical protein SAMN05518847_110136 [Paenibacillus sp. OV219]